MSVEYRRIDGKAAVMKLNKRTYLLSTQMREEYLMAKAFLAPQREHPKQPMPVRKAS